MSIADDEIAAAAGELDALRKALGSAYWTDAGVLALQARLKHLIGAYGAWGEDKMPMHQRSRRAARHESECAHLLWPGRSDD